MLTSSLERRITLHQLRIFKTVVDLKGVTRASEALALSQSAVTHQMEALAKAVGPPLFHPGRRTLELTPVGQALAERADRLLAWVRETGEALDDIAGLRGGSVRVAGDTTAGIYVLPDALAAFRLQHPDVQLSLDVVNRKTVRELLLSGDADLGVAGRLWDDDLLESEPLIDNELACYSAPDHPLAGREPLEQRDLIDGPLLLREPGSGTRESAGEILRANGVGPHTAIQRTSNAPLKRAVTKGLG